jgi:hypothetical protein
MGYLPAGRLEPVHARMNVDGSDHPKIQKYKSERKCGIKAADRKGVGPRYFVKVKGPSLELCVDWSAHVFTAATALPRSKAYVS